MNRNGKTVRDHMQAWNEAGKGCKEQSGSTETESYKTDFSGVAGREGMVSVVP